MECNNTHSQDNFESKLEINKLSLLGFTVILNIIYACKDNSVTSHTMTFT